MFPNALLIFLFILLATSITIISFLLPKRIGSVVEITLAIAVLAYLFISFPFTEAVMLMSFTAIAYGNSGILLNRDKQKKRIELKQQLKGSEFQTIMQRKNFKRIAVDLLLTVFISTGALMFFIFAPETYSLLKFFIGFLLITVFTQMIERIGNFFSTQLYWLPNEERLIILSAFESRGFPLGDVKEVKRESAPDLLRLHPLFTFLSANKDFTSSFQPVLRLSFPGEDVYVTPDEIGKWEQNFIKYADVEQKNQVKKVLPLWHPANLKRLFWKGYFAITVKGISAYTGLLFILIWLEVPSYVIIGFVLIWWLFNIYISDRVLIAGTDAIQLTEGELFKRAKIIFRKAGIPHTKLYIVDSPIHNGFATGMNIGRGAIMLTKATTQLSIHTVEAILAHEAIHIKKRDVLTNQLGRALFFGFVAGVVYLFFDQINWLADHLFVFIPLFYIVMMLFPMYLSFIAQWTEVRADHLGAELLPDGAQQMAAGLRELGNAQDTAQEKLNKYSMADGKPLNNTLTVERGKWFFRLIEFQFLAHPPLYFRIRCLSKQLTWANARKAWMMARLTESVPGKL